MPRRFIKKFVPHPQKLRERWYFRMFGRHITDSRLWSTNRRAITAALGTSLAICFVPLPVHIPLAILIAIACRLNLPVIIAPLFVVNPLTVVPIYYFAYRVGTTLLDKPVHRFKFSLSWEWLQFGLGPMWKPFLFGCLVCALVFGLGGYFAFEGIWRFATVRRMRARRSAATAAATNDA